MKKITLLLFAILASWQVNSQANYNYGWEPTGLGSWVSAGTGTFARNTTTPCTGAASARANVYYDGTNTFTSPSLGTSIGGLVTFQFSYKVTNYGANTTGAPANLVQIDVQWANSTAGPWTTFKTINSANHVVSSSCATISENFLPTAGNLFVRFSSKAIGANSDLYFYYDNIVVSEVSLGPPTIDNFAPTSGCSSTGVVVITGTNLAGATAVSIGGTPVSSYVVNSPTQITAVIGNGTTGVISVTTSSGSIASNDTFTVNISPANSAIAGGSSTVCVGESTSPFTNATAGGVWSIVNGTGSATIDAAGIVTGVTAGTAIVNYTTTNTTCDTVVTFPITVNALPNPITVTPSTQTICENEIQLLSVSGNVLNVTGTIGSGTSLTGNTSQPTAFCNRWTSYWSQSIYTAAELTALGFSAGSNITSMAYNITTLGDGATNANFTVKIGNYASTTFTNSTFLPTTTYTTVFGPSTYTHTATGLQEITFTAPFTWDGTSNIVVNVTMSGANSIYNSITYYTATTGNTILYATNFTGSTTTGTTSTNRLNLKLTGQSVAPATWAPTTGLYTDAAATVAYTGTVANSVYSKTNADITYTVTASNQAGCVTTASSSLTVLPATALPTGISPQTFNAGQTLADLVVNGTDLLWYSDAAGTISIPSSTPLVDGTSYYVSQTEVGSCESETLEIVANEALSTNSFNNANFNLYPNPVKDVLNLSYISEISSVRVLNLLGQEVISKKVGNSSTQIDMTSLNAGAYILNVTIGDVVKSLKVIKQ